MNLNQTEIDLLKERSEVLHTGVLKCWEQIGMLWDNLPDKQQYSVGGEVYSLSWTGKTLAVRLVAANLHPAFRELVPASFEVLMAGLMQLYKQNWKTVFDRDDDFDLEFSLWVKTPPLDGEDRPIEYSSVMAECPASSMTSKEDIDKMLRVLSYSIIIMEFYLNILLRSFLLNLPKKS